MIDQLFFYYQSKIKNSFPNKGLRNVRFIFNPRWNMINNTRRKNHQKILLKKYLDRHKYNINQIEKIYELLKERKQNHTTSFFKSFASLGVLILIPTNTFVNIWMKSKSIQTTFVIYIILCAIFTGIWLIKQNYLNMFESIYNKTNTMNNLIQIIEDIIIEENKDYHLTSRYFAYLIK